MGKPRTVVFAVAARGELLDVARAAVAALGNLLCLSMPPEEGLPRLGICSLSLSTTTGKAQLQVRLRPGDLNLRDFHAAALKLQPGRSAEALDGAQVALALQSLAGVLLQDAGSKASAKSITLITDRLPPADDFATYLEMAAAKNVGLDVVVLCEGGTASAVAGPEAGWAAAEAARPGLLRVSVVEVAGKAATTTVARALLGCVTAPVAPSGAVTLDFGAPLLGALRSLQLESHPLVRPLSLGASHAALCGCHGAPVALRAPATGNVVAPLALHRRLRCPVTGVELDPKTGCVQDGRAVCLGDSPAAVIHLNTPLTLSPAAAGPAASSEGGPEPAVLRVMHRVALSSINASFLVGPAVLLGARRADSGGSGGGVITVGLEGQAVEVMPQHVLDLVAAGLEAKGECLLCSSAWDVGAGPSARSGLFRRHFLLLPSALTPESSENERASLIAFRVAAVEELEPRREAGAVGVGVPPPSPAVAAAVAAGLERLQLGPYSPVDCSCRVHEVVDMLCCESRPAPKPSTAAVVAAATVAADNGGGGEGPESGRGGGGGGGGQQPVGRGRGTARRR